MQQFYWPTRGAKARFKFESLRYGVSSTIQISSKFKLNPKPYLQPRSLSEAVGGVHGGKYQFGPGSFTGDAFAAALASLRSEVNNSLIIVNFFHKIQNFRQISDLF